MWLWLCIPLLPLQVCLNFLGGDAGETPGMCAALTDRGINRGIVPDLPTPDWRKTNSPPMGPEQIKYTLPSSTPGVTAIRGGLSAGGTQRGRQRVRGHFRNISAITPWVYFSSCFNAWIPSFIHPPCRLYLQVEAITLFGVICRLSDHFLKRVRVVILLKALRRVYLCKFSVVGSDGLGLSWNPAAYQQARVHLCSRVPSVANQLLYVMEFAAPRTCLPLFPDPLGTTRLHHIWHGRMRFSLF